MKRLFLFLLASLLIIGMATPFLPTAEADLTDSSTFTSSTSDGYINYPEAATYSTAHDSLSGQVQDSTQQPFLGQLYASTYYIFRGFLFFDTSAIPNLAVVDEAILSLYVTQNNTSTDFNVTVQNGQPTYPHDPLVAGDYYYDHYSGDGGSRNTTEISEIGYWNITLSETGEDWVSVTGTTKLCLRSSNDIDSVAPTGEEYIAFYSADFDFDHAPKLYVTYTVASGDYYEYTFHGPFNEETGCAIDENVTVKAYRLESQTPETFWFNGTYIYNSTYLIQFFQFNFIDSTVTHEYWVDPSESSEATVYIFHANATGYTTTGYTINFMDTAGILNNYPYVTVKRYVNGTLFTVEKRKADQYGSILASLIQTRTYSLYLGSEDVTYVFGDLTMTSQTSIQLVLRSVDFPTDTDFLVMHKYVQVYGYRNFSAGSITVNYNDTKENTESVEVVIRNSTDTCYSNTFYTPSFSAEWTSAVNGVTYYMEVTIHHGDYGTVEWRQTFPATSDVTPPFSLAFLGDWGFESEYLVPSLIVLCVAGCFSKLNAYVGAILMMIMATALAWAGWFPVPASMLVFGFTLAILMALAYHKRGVA